MKKFFQEFKEFAVKGNVIDLAVAVIIGGAFGKIISSLVADIVMPFVGAIIGGVDFTNIRWTLRKAVLGDGGATVAPAVTMNIGSFLQNVFDFLVIAAVIFLLIKIIGRLKKQLVREQTKETPLPIVPTKDQELLTEIRDLLKK
jgi:large conductance mechanosensitive channel